MILYDAYRSGMQPMLPELPIQYSDYASVLNQWLKGETKAALVNHWKAILAGELPTLDLPTDRQRPSIQTDHGLRFSFNIQPALMGTIKQFCQDEHVTPFQLFLAAYGVLIMRYSGQEDIIVGCPFANRPRPEQDGLIGLFVNTLPVRLNLGGDPSIRELLIQVRSLVLDAFTWQALPFETIVAEISPTRDLSRTPIYQAIINMRNVPKRPISIPGLEIEPVNREETPSVSDISLEFSPGDDHYEAAVVYNADLFDRTTIQRMVTHYQNILAEILLHPEYRISVLQMLSDAETHQILVEWNKTEADYPREKCIHQLFEEQVERFPDRTAVMDGERQITYRDLNAKANQIAHYLCRLGAGPEVPVGLYLQRNGNLIAAILGVLKAGSPYIPLDTLHPDKRRGMIIRDSGMKILVFDDYCKIDETPNGITYINLDEQKDSLEAESAQNMGQISIPENLAYIIYTSGSTGEPKGVEINHCSVVDRILSLIKHLEIPENGLSLSVTSPAFDPSVLDYLAPLYTGGTIVLASPNEITNSELLAKRIQDLRLTWMFATPITWHMLFDAGWPGKTDLKILVGGDILPPDLAERLMRTCGDVFNLYGPTETTIWCTYARLKPGQPVTIGRPIGNTNIYILDTQLRLVPVGVPGEIFVGGIGLAHGYHNLPGLTASKFVPDPFSKWQEGRLFRTGDMGRWLKDGNIEYLGRKDNQVKIRGYRVELGEIEAIIREFPEVRQALVLAQEDQPGDNRLVAYVVPNPGKTLESKILRDFLGVKLPNYMIPTAFVWLDTFPVTVTGKIDRLSIPIQETGTLENQEYIAPHSHTEQSLAKIWMSVLRIRRVGLRDNFFELGGHSLSAVRVMARIRAEFGITISLRKIFEFPDLSELAAQVDYERFYQKPNIQPDSGNYNQEEFLL